MAARNGNGRTAWQRITKAQRELFLEQTREGADRPTAATVAGAPARAFRALCRFDPLFEADYEAARQEGRKPIAEKLRATLLQRALDPSNPNGRDLHHAMLLWDDEYHARLGSARVGLAVGGKQLEVVLAFLGEGEQDDGDS